MKISTGVERKHLKERKSLGLGYGSSKNNKKKRRTKKQKKKNSFVKAEELFSSTLLLPSLPPEHKLGERNRSVERERERELEPNPHTKNTTQHRDTHDYTRGRNMIRIEVLPYW